MLLLRGAMVIVMAMMSLLLRQMLPLMVCRLLRALFYLLYFFMLRHCAPPHAAHTRLFADTLARYDTARASCCYSDILLRLRR